MMTPLDDLGLFYSKVNFGNFGFYLGKSETNGFFLNCCSLRPETWQMQTTNEVNKGNSMCIQGQCYFMMIKCSKIRLQVSDLRTNDPLVL